MTAQDTASGAAIAAAFDDPAPMTVGIEEEVMLVDPATLDLAPVAGELLGRIEQAGGDPRFKLELPMAQFEIVSPPLPSAAAAADFLRQARRDLAAHAGGLARLACAGVHPFAHPEGELNAGERYDRTLGEYGRIARRQLVFGLQAHVAVRGADRALAVYNALRGWLPELLALAANAPFYAGEDTGLATIRPKINELLPRQGVPPVIASWDDWAAALRWGAALGTVPDPGVWWWELRPHPAWGTLEVRVPDAQATVDDAAGVVAAIHCLAHWLAARHDAGETLPAPATWRIEENRWRALSRGLDGELADLETGETASARQRLRTLFDQLSESARELGCERELGFARALTESNGAERQRAAAGGDARAAVEWLIASY
ncbi:MAG: glutamate---cysteine ligase / carboxylate-amine ligase [Thermoleophilales bacterium]|nr:glutamate---cysteine ligase / carboxylate-amine ligase [Thermoleophilales bacterium]